jgi:hypothetical protein
MVKIIRYSRLQNVFEKRRKLILEKSALYKN